MDAPFNIGCITATSGLKGFLNKYEKFANIASVIKTVNRHRAYLSSNPPTSGSIHISSRQFDSSMRFSLNLFYYKGILYTFLCVARKRNSLEDIIKSGCEKKVKPAYYIEGDEPYAIKVFYINKKYREKHLAQIREEVALTEEARNCLVPNHTFLGKNCRRAANFDDGTGIEKTNKFAMYEAFFDQNFQEHLDSRNISISSVFSINKTSMIDAYFKEMKEALIALLIKLEHLHSINIIHSDISTNNIEIPSIRFL